MLRRRVAIAVCSVPLKPNETVVALPSHAKRKRSVSPGIESSDNFYRELVDSLTEYAIFTVTLDGTVTTWNAGAHRTFGYAAAEIIGRQLDVLFPTTDSACEMAERELAEGLRDGRADRDCWHVRKDGVRFWGTRTVQPLYDAAGHLTGYSTIVRDITRTHLSETALAESEERFRLLIESVGDYAIFSLSPEGKVTLWNSGAAHTFGYSAKEILGKSFSLLFNPTDVENGVVEAEIREASVEGSADAERWYVRKDGTRLFATGRLTRLAADPSGGANGFVKVAHDITQRKFAEDSLRYEAFHDKMTGLPNRTLFMDHLQRAVAHAKRQKNRRFAVLFLDLDGFKAVNDEYGHAMADLLLIEVAHRLEHAVRPEDVVARIGGDEFTVLLPEVDGSAQAVAVAQRIRSTFAKPIYFGQNALVKTASIGITIGSSRYDRAEQVLRDADIAMYEAKARGRNNFLVFDEGMYSHDVSRRLLESELCDAIEKNQFVVEYQPIFELGEIQVAGFEALVRWNHPRRGVLQPGEFIAAAEETDSIVAIDRLVLSAACRQLAYWQRSLKNAGSLTVSVNLSGKEFSRPDLLTAISETLTETGVSPANLKLEITESVLIEQSESVSRLFASIRALGIDFHIDDFGTGYSALGYLRRFGASTLKIDRFFIQGMMDSEDSAEIVRTIVALAHNLRLTAIAEGVETAEQLRTLRELRCDYAQGYYLARPLDARRAEELIVGGPPQILSEVRDVRWTRSAMSEQMDDSGIAEASLSRSALEANGLGGG